MQELLDKLTEVYQPIFGHPELSTRFSRPCEDRLELIEKVYAALAAKLGRAPCVLDLGCAQGYFSLSLARHGATVYGIDFQRESINVCTALAAEHPTFDVHFQLGLVEKIIENLVQGQCDLVLGLSIFHHLINRFGIESVQGMLASLAQKTVAGIYEMALASEPMEWAPNQPDNPRMLMKGYSFVHEVGRHSGYVATTQRPLYVASNHFWFLGDNLGEIHSSKSEGHPYVNRDVRGTRSYFFNNAHMAKVFTLDSDASRDINKNEMSNEISLLKNPPSNVTLPKLVAAEINESEAWLVRECLPGELLFDRIRAGTPFDADVVFKDILQQLAGLEAHGLYHGDLRTWNILIAPDGHASLIDYGAVVRSATDTVWPNNVFLSFMIVTHEFLCTNVNCPFPLRAYALNPGEFPEPYRALFKNMLETPPSQWSFATLAKELKSPSARSGGTSTEGLTLALQKATEAANLYQEKIGQVMKQKSVELPAMGKTDETQAIKPVAQIYG